jgi:hypothetical protein
VLSVALPCWFLKMLIKTLHAILLVTFLKGGSVEMIAKIKSTNFSYLS